MISFIVSAYERPLSLRCCLASLAVQEGDNEIIVCANNLYWQHEQVVNEFLKDPVYEKPLNIRWIATRELGAVECYDAAAIAAKEAKGDYLCFPSDDSMYVQGFAREMIYQAKANRADLVYCDCIYRQDPRIGKWPDYKFLITQPLMGRIDKTCFIVRRDLFTEFPPHPKGWRDGALIEQLVSQGVRHAKATGVLVVHQ